MSQATRKLKKLLKNLFRVENQQLVEFVLLASLASTASVVVGAGMMSHVDTAFRNLGSTIHSYVK